MVAGMNNPVGKSPCKNHCEATAFQIEIRSLKNRIVKLQGELDSLKNDPMTKRHYNQIIADWIEKEAWFDCTYRGDGYYAIWKEDFEKLRSNDEKLQ